MEVLYHIRPYFMGIFPYRSSTQALHTVGTSNESVPGMAIELGLIQDTYAVFSYTNTNTHTCTYNIHAHIHLHVHLHIHIQIQYTYTISIYLFAIISWGCKATNMTGTGPSPWMGNESMDSGLSSCQPETWPKLTVGFFNQGFNVVKNVNPHENQQISGFSQVKPYLHSQNMLFVLVPKVKHAWKTHELNMGNICQM